MWWYTYTEGLCIAAMHVFPTLMDPVLENSTQWTLTENTNLG